MSYIQCDRSAPGLDYSKTDATTYTGKTFSRNGDSLLVEGRLHKFRSASFFSLRPSATSPEPNSSRRTISHKNKKSRTLLEVETPRRLVFRRRHKVISENIITASLRRRLWQAFTENDGDAALRCWTARREDWEDWENAPGYNDDFEARGVLPNGMGSTDFFSAHDRLSLTAPYLTEENSVTGASRTKLRRRNPFRKAPRVGEDDTPPTTPMHQAARLGDTSLVEALAVLAQDWNVRDGHGRTILHCALAGDRIERPPSVYLTGSKNQAPIHPIDADDEDRLAIMQLCVEHGVSIHAVDSSGRTALHYAALRGMMAACEFLLSCSFDNAMLTLIDNMGQTPCELAASENHSQLAANLEARALLYRDAYGTEEVMAIPGGAILSAPPFTRFETDTAAHHRWLTLNVCSNNVKKIVGVAVARETSMGTESFEPNSNSTDSNTTQSAQKLNGLHFGHLERLLTHYRMSSKAVSDAIFDDPFRALENANTCAPPDPSEAASSELQSDKICPICCDTFEEDPSKLKSIEGCHHVFCVDCWGDYLKDCNRNKETGVVIPCPHHNCNALLSPSEIEEFAGPEIHSELVATSVDLFVRNDPNHRFCPHPDCGLPVRFNNGSSDPDEITQLIGAVCTGQKNSGTMSSAETIKTYEGVPFASYHDLNALQPIPRAHRFCFGCNATSIHWPIRCDRLQEWKQAIVDHVGEDEEGASFNEVAQKLWLKANTRPCPKVC